MQNTVINCGNNTFHNNDFRHHLPHGMQFWVFLNMLTPHVINTDKGMQLTQPGDCIVYRPGQPRYLHCPDDLTSFRNNWVHFQGDQISQRMAQYKIPVRKLFVLKQAMPINNTIQEITYEFSQTRSYSEEMQSALVEMLLLHIARNIMYRSDAQKLGTMQHYDNFEHLRREMYLNPERDWTVLNMARRVFLGHNQFTSLYSKYYGTTPKRDLINARLQKAKSLLSVSLTLREVSIACGFQNEYYFSRIFHQNVGVTAGQYREQKLYYNLPQPPAAGTNPAGTAAGEAGNKP